MNQPQHVPHDPPTGFDFDYAPGALEVRICELAVATADQSDPIVDDALRTVLRILREQHATDAAFVLELVDGRRVQRSPNGAAYGSFHTACFGNPLDFAMARQAVPRTTNAACYVSVPVVLLDGRVYGTLYGPCCDLAEEARQRDLARLEMTAQLAARLIDARRARAPTPGTAATAQA
ncbi:hypothetical protein [Variovorax arabinosiphilus]|uniref:hypothetical protein n=1 Tax=Variovorax arabinosiphilus TaxID=3053498 RepID=UPI0025775C31|nr:MULTISPECIES: hypothetical protein [unclassified Variovorax]MDM0118784.1 hypothetical protein [Variovorax sp. J2L1-78]MDM0129209.1 hypothetical protein [Variovorax sp. J2L1-63]MDM0233004.1 hypothetical protein [Variovorax sp. J2R1-6]